MTPPLTTELPPARHLTFAGATWTRAANPKGIVLVNGERMDSVFAVNEQIGLAAAYYITADGRYVLDAPGRYRVRRLHGVILVKR